MSTNRRKLFKANKSLDRTMSIDSTFYEGSQMRVGQMSLDSTDAQHLWAHGHHAMSKSRAPAEKPVVEEVQKLGRERVQFRRFLVLQRVTRRSWPTSHSWWVTFVFCTVCCNLVLKTRMTLYAWNDCTLANLQTFMSDVRKTCIYPVSSTIHNLYNILT